MSIIEHPVQTPEDLYGDENLCPDEECDTAFYGTVCPECGIDLDEYYFVEPDEPDYDYDDYSDYHGAWS